MSTSNANTVLNSALAGVEKKYREKIIKHYVQAKSDFAEGRIEPCSMASAKLCEVIIRVLQSEAKINVTPLNKSIGNFANECRKIIESSSANMSDGLRVVMPRMLVCLYTFRNKRNVGHVGGDVDSNNIDAATVIRLADWIVCELIRVKHGMSLEEAQDLVDQLTTKNLPEVWVVGGKKRVLRTDLNTKDKTLLLCYHDRSSNILVEDLVDWIEYSSISMFKTRSLRPLHKEKLIEFDEENDVVIISPTGSAYVERLILSKVIS